MSQPTNSTGPFIAPQQHGPLQHQPPQEHHHHHHHQQQPDVMMIVTVPQACEQLWACQEAAVAPHWLQVTHHALSRARLDTYSPSEAFLSIQGTALRFSDQIRELQAAHLKHDGDRRQPSIDETDRNDHEELIQAIWEEALWAAANLARICVGPAWRYQWLRRRSMLLTNQNRASQATTANTMTTGTATPVLMARGGGDDGTVSTATESLGPSPLTANSAAAQHHHATFAGTLSPSTGEPHQSTQQRPFEVDVVGGGNNGNQNNSTNQNYAPTSPRSFSPMTFASTQYTQGMLPYAAYPSIPEALPGVMLRFAAQAMEFCSSMSLAEAQRELVLAICCLSPEEEEAHYHHLAPGEAPQEWTIPGAHVPVDSMMQFWLQNTTILSPPTDIFEEVVENQDDARKAKLGAHQFSSSDITEPVEHVQENPLDYEEGYNVQKHDRKPAAVPTSIEALEDRKLNWWFTLQVTRASTDLISVGWRPQAGANTVTIHLLDIARKGMSLEGLVLLRPDQPSQTDKQAREEIVAATLSAAEAVGALGALLSRGTLPSNLLPLCLWSLVDINVMASKHSVALLNEYFPESQIFESSNEEAEWHAERETWITTRDSCMSEASNLMWVMLAQETSAVAAFRTLQDMLVQKDENEEAYLSRALIVMRVLTGALWGRPPSTAGIGALRIFWEGCFKLLSGKTTGVLRSPPMIDSIVVALEVIMALSRFVEGELLGRQSNLTQTEWDTLIQILDEDLLPLLQIGEMLSNSDEGQLLVDLIGKTKTQVEILLSKLGDYLYKASNFESSPVHLIVDDDCRMRLFLLLMRRACPLLSHHTSSSIGRSVVRSWSSVASLPMNMDSIVESVTAILCEAFAQYDDRNSGEKHGFVHSALVRTEALGMLTDDSSFLMVRIGSVPMCSALTLTRNLPQIHSRFLDSALLPALSLVFNPDSERALATIKISGLPRAEKAFMLTGTNSFVDDEEKRLRMFATTIVGKLFRTNSVGDLRRNELIATLKSAALSKIEDGEAGESDSDDSDDESFSVSPSALPGDVAIALEAIWQLELCLETPFNSQPMVHHKVSSILLALCEILQQHSLMASSEVSKKIPSRRLLSFAALLPLSRLRSSSGGRMVLLDRGEVLKFVPDSVAPTLAKETHWTDEGEGRDTFTPGPFVFEGDAPQGDKNERSYFSFVSIVEALCDAVRSSRSEEESSSIDPELNSMFRACCFDALGSFVISGVKVNNVQLMVDVLQDEPPTWTLEAMAVCKASAAIVPRLLFSSGGLVDKHTKLDDPICSKIEMLVHQVLEACTSVDIEVVAVGCLALKSMISTLVVCHKLIGDPSSIYADVLSTLTSRMQKLLESFRKLEEGKSLMNEQFPGPSDFAFPLVSAIYNILLASRDANASLELSLRTDIIMLCDRLVREPRAEKPCRALVIRCAWIALDTIEKGGVEHVVSRLAEEREHSELTAENQADAEIAFSIIAHRQIGNAPGVTGVEGFHSFSSKESDCIRHFPTHKVGTEEKASAWLCGDCVLSIRVGDKSSRYCGWVELVLRGPSLRRRKLVRLKSRAFISLDDPERFTLALKPKRATLVAAKNPVPVDRSSFPKALMSPGNDDIITKAKALLARSEVVLGPLPSGDRFPRSGESDGSLNRDQSPRSLRSKSSGSLGNLGQQPSNESISVAGCENDSLYSDETIPALAECATIRVWLMRAFGNEEMVADVTDSLADLGILSNVLDDADGEVGDSGNPFLPAKKLRWESKLVRGLNVLDRTSPLNTHKLGLFYANSQAAITSDTGSLERSLLTTPHASTDFFTFTEGIGQLVETARLKYWSGGLDTSGDDADGQNAIVWFGGGLTDYLTMVLFHTVPLFPNDITRRKRHVGNDHVHIVFVDPGSSLYQQLCQSGSDVEMDCIVVSGHFGFIAIFVLPLEDQLCRLAVRLKSGLRSMDRAALEHLCGDYLLPAERAAIFVRQIAVCADIIIASLLEEMLGTSSNWEERWNQLKAFKRYIK